LKMYLISDLTNPVPYAVCTTYIFCLFVSPPTASLSLQWFEEKISEADVMIAAN
jgi:hypothetical protein